MKRLILVFVILFLHPAIVSAHPHTGGEAVNPTNDLINVFSTTFGPVMGVLILGILVMLAIITPLFAWGIRNQTTRMANEITKLNRLIEGLNLQQTLNKESAKQPGESRTKEKVEELFKKLKKDLPGKEELPEMPLQAFKRRKVFIKPEEELPNPRKKTG